MDVLSDINFLRSSVGSRFVVLATWAHGGSGGEELGVKKKKHKDV